MEDTLDAKILDNLVKKASRIFDDYGFTPPYFSSDSTIFDVMEDQDVSTLQDSKQLRLPFYEESAEFVDPFQEETLQKIEQDSFYGQEDVKLDEVRERRRETENKIVSKEKLRDFVELSLDYLGGDLIEQDDDVFKVKLQDPSLEVSGLEDEFQATFEAKRGLDNEKVEVLDLAHPLIRRLINLMKQETFDKDSDLYGRIAYKVNPEFEEVKALAWVLARYVVESETASIVEELIPIIWPVYSDGEPEIDESVWELPSKGNIDPDELQEHLDFLYEDRDG
jgi:hypothetical protein